MNKHIGGFLGLLKNARPGWSATSSTSGSTPSPARPPATTATSQSAAAHPKPAQVSTGSSDGVVVEPTTSRPVSVTTGGVSAPPKPTTAPIANGFKPLHTTPIPPQKEAAHLTTPSASPSKNLFAKPKPVTSTESANATKPLPALPEPIAPTVSESTTATPMAGVSTGVVDAASDTNGKESTVEPHDGAVSRDSAEEPAEEELNAPQAKRAMQEPLLLAAASNGDEQPQHIVDEAAIVSDARVEQTLTPPADAALGDDCLETNKDALAMPPPQTVPEKAKAPRKPRAKKNAALGIVAAQPAEDLMAVDGETQKIPAPKKQRRRSPAKATATASPVENDGVLPSQEDDSTSSAASSSDVSVAPKKPRKPRAPRKAASTTDTAPMGDSSSSSTGDDVQRKAGNDDNTALVDQQSAAVPAVKKARKPRAKKPASISADDIIVDEDGIYVKVSRNKRATVKDEYVFDDGFAVRDDEEEEVSDADADFVLPTSYDDDEESSVLAESTLSSYDDEDRDLSYDELSEVVEVPDAPWPSEEGAVVETESDSALYLPLTFDIDASNVLPARSVRKRHPVRTEYALLVSSREKSKFVTSTDSRGRRSAHSNEDEAEGGDIHGNEEHDDFEVEGGVRMIVVDSDDDDEHEFVHIAELDNPSDKRAARKLAKVLQDGEENLADGPSPADTAVPDDDGEDDADADDDHET